MPSVDARELFAPLGPSYDRVGAVLSFGQDPLWRRFLASRLPRDGGHVLDVATGTGLVAAELDRRGFSVTGVDQSAEMLARARRRFGDTVELVEASADSLPFADASFDHLTFTYLLRYVDDPGEDAARAVTRRSFRRNGRVPRVRRPGWTRASGVGAVRRRGAPARRTRASERLARGRRLPRRLDPLVLGDVSHRASARPLECRGHRETSRFGA